MTTRRREVMPSTETVDGHGQGAAGLVAGDRRGAIRGRTFTPAALIPAHPEPCPAVPEAMPVASPTPDAGTGTAGTPNTEKAHGR